MVANRAPETSGDEAERDRMVREQLVPRGIRDPRVLEAMGRVPRHRFVPAELREDAYRDRPLPIGWGQTISQPFVVAAMTQHLELRGPERALEIGTGSGYQTAVLAQLCARVFSIEIVPELAGRARATLAELGVDNAEVRVGDGYRGWPEEAPFDAIALTAAPDHLPPPLLEQLALAGRMVLPLGRGVQELVRVTRDEAGVHSDPLLEVRFVPMTGEAEQRP